KRGSQEKLRGTDTTICARRPRPVSPKNGETRTGHPREFLFLGSEGSCQGLKVRQGYAKSRLAVTESVACQGGGVLCVHYLEHGGLSGLIAQCGQAQALRRQFSRLI